MLPPTISARSLVVTLSILLATPVFRYEDIFATFKRSPSLIHQLYVDPHSDRPGRRNQSSLSCILGRCDEFAVYY